MEAKKKAYLALAEAVAVVTEHPHARGEEALDALKGQYIALIGKPVCEAQYLLLEAHAQAMRAQLQRNQWSVN